MVPRADAFELPSHDADLDGPAGVAGSVVLGTLAGANETRNDRSAMLATSTNGEPRG